MIISINSKYRVIGIIQLTKCILNFSILEFVNDGDWVERFIQAVQSRPPIYNTKLPEHSDRNLILRLWSEIFETMIPTWQAMTSSEKSLKGNETKQNNY